MNESELIGSRRGYKIVTKDLAGQVAAVRARKALRRATEFGVDVGIVIRCLYSKATALQ